MNAPFVWTPTHELRTRSRAARFMSRHALETVDALIQRSVQEPDWFWPAIIAELGITFFEPYRQLVDVSSGPAWARWFEGGRINLAFNTLDVHIAGPAANNLALIHETEDAVTTRWTYQRLYAETCKFANALLQLGVKPGERVGLFLPMCPQAVAAFLAVARLGAIAVPIFSGFGAEAVATRLNDCAAVALITADGVRRKGRVIPLKSIADAAVTLSPSVRHTIVINRVDSNPALRAGFDHDWTTLAQTVSAEHPCKSVPSETPFLIGYTSGTTGKPKGAVHVHAGFLVKIAQEVAFQVDMHQDDTLFWLTDLGWIMGPWEIVGGLATGGTLVLYDGAPDYPDPGRLWSLVAQHGVTILGVSPTLIRALMRQGDHFVTRHNLSRLRILASTGEPWNHDPWLWYFHTIGGGRCPIINLSGGTEVAACFLSPLPVTPLKPCTLGGPALGMHVDVVDPAGNPLRNGVGELICRSPWPGMTRGLWNDPDRYLETYWSRFPGVWTHGDWASIDADGLWFLHGRSDDTLNIAGKRIGPAEIESAIVGHPSVAEAAAIGIPHELKGESAWCFVVLKPGESPSDTLANAIREHAAQSLGKSFAPDTIRFVSELPRTRNAKILRRALRACVLGLDPGDLSNLENPSALAHIEPLQPRETR